MNDTSLSVKIVSRPVKSKFIGIPQSPLCYWLREKFSDLLSGKTVGDVASVVQGLVTANDIRFVRYTWGISPREWGESLKKRRWVPF